MEIANRKIVEFIRDKWVIPMNNNSQFATENNIDEKRYEESGKTTNTK
jgi:hypothetical protein